MQRLKIAAHMHLYIPAQFRKTAPNLLMPKFYQLNLVGQLSQRAIPIEVDQFQRLLALELALELELALALVWESASVWESALESA